MADNQEKLKILKDLFDEPLVSLCLPCHNKTNTNRKRWEKFFKKHITIH